MKAVLFSMAFALALYGCGRQEPTNPAQIEQARQSEKTPGEAKPLTDTSLTQIVRAALESESSLDARKIEVENREGMVALRGTVGSEEQREKAGRIVGSVGGVKSVDNRLAVDEAASTG
ncbi:MAG TPA: BON domain-containing protein, partial [Burkholderiales bacterium]